ncbi:MAG: cytochrome c [bacterium]|nr:cytochrome c [bacterium]
MTRVEQNSTSTNAFFPVLILFGIMGLLLIALLGQNQSGGNSDGQAESTEPAQVAQAEVTEVTATEVEATEAAAESTAAVEAAAEGTATAEGTAESDTTAEATLDATSEATAEATEEVFDPARAYAFACAGCHGLEGEGVADMGPALVNNLSISEVGLIDLLTEGQQPTAPQDEFVHPYRGGVIELTDAQIAELAAYLQELVGAR